MKQKKSKKKKGNSNSLSKKIKQDIHETEMTAII